MTSPFPLPPLIADELSDTRGRIRIKDSQCPVLATTTTIQVAAELVRRSNLVPELLKALEDLTHRATHISDGDWDEEGMTELQAWDALEVEIAAARALLAKVRGDA